MTFLDIEYVERGSLQYEFLVMSEESSLLEEVFQQE